MGFYGVDTKIPNPIRGSAKTNIFFMTSNGRIFFFRFSFLLQINTHTKNKKKIFLQIIKFKNLMNEFIPNRTKILKFLSRFL